MKKKITLKKKTEEEKTSQLARRRGSEKDDVELYSGRSELFKGGGARRSGKERGDMLP